MEVKEFFNKSTEEIINFDFTNEVLINKRVSTAYKDLKQKYLSDDINPLNKYILYKTKFKIDPDNNKGLLKEIYIKLWNKEILECCESNDKAKYCSDTMTSAQNLLNGYYLSFCIDEWNQYKETNKVKYFGINIMNNMIQEQNKYPSFKKAFDREEIQNFIKYYHTLGNYIPVPKGFNVARSGTFASHDMWDITLRKIKEYYKLKLKYDIKRDNIKVVNKLFEIVVQLLHMKDSINNTISWLNSFNSWEEFVDQNYLKEINGHKNYVDQDYNINPLSEHDFDEPELGKDEYLNYFKEVTEIIKGRTLIMKEAFFMKENK